MSFRGLVEVVFGFFRRISRFLLSPTFFLATIDTYVRSLGVWFSRTPFDFSVLVGTPGVIVGALRRLAFVELVVSFNLELPLQRTRFRPFPIETTAFEVQL